MADNYVIVHGAWHTGAEMEATARHLRDRGHVVHCPTLAGNGPNDDRASIGLADAVNSLVNFIERNDLQEVRLVGHSYAGMIISHMPYRLPYRIRRLVYWNAFVPLNGECLMDLGPPQNRKLFDSAMAANHHGVMLPYPVWRECFINDADEALARSSYELLNPHPFRTFTDPAVLPQPLAALSIGKSYLNARQDIAMPHSLPWHPRLSERLGLFRLIECDGSHELCFSNPALLARKIEEAGRD